MRKLQRITLEVNGLQMIFKSLQELELFEKRNFSSYQDLPVYFVCYLDSDEQGNAGFPIEKFEGINADANMIAFVNSLY